jgi:hypothetical protein
VNQPPAAAYTHELRQAQRTGEDRVLWLAKDQTRVVLRVRDGLIVLAVWNKGKALRTTDLLTVEREASVPAHAKREDAVRGDWHGILFRWQGEPT